MKCCCYVHARYLKQVDLIREAILMILHLMKGTHQQNTFLSSYKGHGADSEYYCSLLLVRYTTVATLAHLTQNVKYRNLLLVLHFTQNLHFYISIYFQAELDSIIACRKILFVKGPTVERVVAMSLNLA